MAELRDDAYDQFFPEEIKQLLQRDDLCIKTCANCHKTGLRRCARCRCQFYCSSDCQKAHFDRHKKNCKAIGKIRKKIASMVDETTPNFLKLAACRINLADKLVKTAYEECETLVGGRMFYIEALRLYTIPLTDPYLDNLKKIFAFLEDRVYLMIMVCGGDTQEILPVFEICRGFGDISKQHHFRWNFLLLLAYIMKLSRYRENMGRVRLAMNEMIVDNNVQGYDDIIQHTSRYLTGENDDYPISKMLCDLRLQIIFIGGLGHGGDLLKLKHESPFTPEHSIGLFSGLSNSLDWIGDQDEDLRVELATQLSEINNGGIAPSECWMIYEKCIRETFGGVEIIREFISDEEDDDGDVLSTA